MVYIKCHKCVYTLQVPHPPKRRSTHSVPGRQRQTPSTPVGPRTLAGWVGAGWLAGGWGEPRLPLLRQAHRRDTRSLAAHPQLPTTPLHVHHPHTSPHHHPQNGLHRPQRPPPRLRHRFVGQGVSRTLPPLQGSPSPPRPPPPPDFERQRPKGASRRRIRGLARSETATFDNTLCQLCSLARQLLPHSLDGCPCSEAVYRDQQQKLRAGAVARSWRRHWRV